jgi:hypothetical protein
MPASRSVRRLTVVSIVDDPAEPRHNWILRVFDNKKRRFRLDDVRVLSDRSDGDPAFVANRIAFGALGAVTAPYLHRRLHGILRFVFYVSRRWDLRSSSFWMRGVELGKR